MAHSPKTDGDERPRGVRSRQWSTPPPHPSFHTAGTAQRPLLIDSRVCAPNLLDAPTLVPARRGLHQRIKNNLAEIDARQVCPVWPCAVVQLRLNQVDRNTHSLGSLVLRHDFS